MGDRSTGTLALAVEKTVTVGKNLILVAVAVVVYLLFDFFSGTPYFDLFQVLVAGALVVLGVMEWRSNGHRWPATLSWAIPMAALWTLTLWLVEGPFAIALLVYFVGGALLFMITQSTRAAHWWYEVVLRRPYKS